MLVICNHAHDCGIPRCPHNKPHNEGGVCHLFVGCVGYNDAKCRSITYAELWRRFWNTVLHHIFPRYPID